MEELKNHLTKALLLAAVLSGGGAMLRFEVEANNNKIFRTDIKENYVKKEQFVEVKADIKYMKENQDKLSAKVDQILHAVNK